MSDITEILSEQKRLGEAATPGRWERSASRTSDVRERLYKLLFEELHVSKHGADEMADAILAAFPILSRDIAGEISVCVECEETEVLGKPEHRVLCMDCAYETGRAAAPAETDVAALRAALTAARIASSEEVAVGGA